MLNIVKIVIKENGTSFQIMYFRCLFMFCAFTTFIEDGTQQEHKQ